MLRPSSRKYWEYEGSVEHSLSWSQSHRISSSSHKKIHLSSSVKHNSFITTPKTLTSKRKSNNLYKLYSSLQKCGPYEVPIKEFKSTIMFIEITNHSINQSKWKRCKLMQAWLSFDIAQIIKARKFTLNSNIFQLINRKSKSRGTHQNNENEQSRISLCMIEINK